MRRLTCNVAVAAVVGIWAPGALAQTVITAGIEATEGSLVYDIMEFFGNDLEARLPGEVEFNLVTGGQLGRDIDVLNGLRLGTHEFSIVCSPVQSLEPTIGIFEAPFLVTSRDDAKKLVFGPIGAEIMANLTAKGVIGLTMTELGFRQITNNVRPIVTVEDLEGLRIRVPNTPFRQVTFQALGANPTPIAFGEVYAALRQGVVDGQENPLPSIYGARFHEVQRYISIANYIFTPCTLLASPAYFDAWPAAVQEAVRASALAAAEFSFVRGAELDARYIEEMRATSEVNDIDAESFRAAARPLWDQVGEQVGGDLMARVIAELND